MNGAARVVHILTRENAERAKLDDRRYVIRSWGGAEDKAVHVDGAELCVECGHPFDDHHYEPPNEGGMCRSCPRDAEGLPACSCFVFPAGDPS